MRVRSVVTMKRHEEMNNLYETGEKRTNGNRRGSIIMKCAQ